MTPQKVAECEAYLGGAWPAKDQEIGMFHTKW